MVLNAATQLYAAQNLLYVAAPFKKVFHLPLMSEKQHAKQVTSDL